MFRVRLPDLLKPAAKMISDQALNARIFIDQNVIIIEGIFARKLELNAKTEEALTYPAMLMVGKWLKQG